MMSVKTLSHINLPYNLPQSTKRAIRLRKMMLLIRIISLALQILYEVASEKEDRQTSKMPIIFVLCVRLGAVGVAGGREREREREREGEREGQWTLWYEVFSSSRKKQI